MHLQVVQILKQHAIEDALSGWQIREDGAAGKIGRFEQAWSTGIRQGMKPKPNRPPIEGFQFFGTLKLDARDKTLTARLHNLAGQIIYAVELPPATIPDPRAA